MTVLSVDLAYKNYRDIGIAVLTSDGEVITCQFEALRLTGEPSPESLAPELVRLAERFGAGLLLIDGPQGWRDDASSLVHSRVCERELNTPAKSGLPGCVKPANYRPFVAFSVEVFDALEGLGWPRLRSLDPSALRGGRHTVETFPLAAWRHLRFPPLPSKRRTRPADIDVRVRLLEEERHVRFASRPNHDELQAVAAGLVGIALERGDYSRVACAGRAPLHVGESWREGFILNPPL